MNTRFSRLLRLYGIAIDLLSLNLIFFVEKFFMQENLSTEETVYINLLMWFNVSWVVVCWVNNLYTEKTMASFENFSRRTMRIFFYWLVLLMAYLSFARQIELSRFFIIIVVITYASVLLGSRFLFLAMRGYMRGTTVFTRKIMIVGYNETAKKLTAYLEDENHLTQIVGYCGTGESISELTHYPIIAQVENALQVSRQYGVEEIYSTIAPEHNLSVNQLMHEAEQACIRFRVIPDFSYFIKRSFHVEFLNDIPVLTMRHEPLEDNINRIKKRLLDISISLFAIMFILSWLVPLLGMLIWLESPGPIFFRQLRSGRNNRSFWCIKFRSMKINNEANTRQATANDTRMTRIGRFIRKTNLDEFPQFLNVLRGEMSLVGPRPHMLKHTDDYSKQIREYMVRHFAKPGITGWAQVNGYRGETKALAQMQGRVEYDIWYLEHWNLWLDVRIIFLTFYNILKGEKNAY